MCQNTMTPPFFIVEWSLLYNKLFRLRGHKKRRQVISWKKIPAFPLVGYGTGNLVPNNALICYESKKYSLPRFFVISIPNKALKRGGIYRLFARFLISS